MEVLYYDRLHDLVLALPQSSGSLDGGTTVGMQFSAFGQEFALELEPNASVNELARALETGPGITAYKGTVSGYPGSWVRLVFAAGGPAGLIWDGEQLYAIESPADTVTSSEATAIYRADDLYVPQGTMTCPMGAMPLQGSTMFEQVVAESFEALALTATVNLDMGIVADFEFATDNSADPAAAMLTRMNNVDGIFSDQVGVRLSIVEIDVFSEEADPFNGTDPFDLLDELTTFRAGDPAQSATGLTHLFTGRNLDDTTVGLAYFGAVCSTQFAASLSESRADSGRGPFLDSLIAAHEIGHSFGAPHDGDPAGDCPDTPEGFLMAPQLSDADQFSACSLETMQTLINDPRMTCLTDIDWPDIELTSGSPDSEQAAGNEFDYVLTLTNRGGETAVAAGLAVDFGAGLEILAATPGAGTCDAPQSTMSCSLGDIPGGSSRDVVFRMRSDTPAVYGVDASSSTTDDNNPANDTVADTITIVPGVDLALSGAAVRVQSGQDAQVSIQLDNLANTAANDDIELTADLGSGARPLTAMLGSQMCNISGQSVSCALGMLAAGSNVELSLSVTAVSVGTQNLTLTATSSELDSNAANNELVLSIDVFAPPSSDSGGGGGALDWVLLLSLAAVTSRRLAGRANASRRRIAGRAAH